MCPVPYIVPENSEAPEMYRLLLTPRHPVGPWDPPAPHSARRLLPLPCWCCCSHRLTLWAAAGCGLPPQLPGLQRRVSRLGGVCSRDGGGEGWGASDLAMRWDLVWLPAPLPFMLKPWEEAQALKRKLLSHLRLFVTPWTTQSMGFSRSEYLRG